MSNMASVVAWGSLAFPSIGIGASRPRSTPRSAAVTAREAAASARGSPRPPTAPTTTIVGHATTDYDSYTLLGVDTRFRNHIFSRPATSQSSSSSGVGLPPMVMKQEASPDTLETRPSSLSLVTPPSTAPRKQSVTTSVASWAPSSTEFEERLKEIVGHEVETLGPSEVWRSKALQAEMEGLRLSENFTARGSPRFQHLGLSFAMRQHLARKAANDTEIERPVAPAKSYYRARAYRLALEAVAVDRESQRKRILTASANAEQAHKATEVNARQLDTMFAGVPAYKDFVPEDVVIADLMPLDCNRDEENKARRSIEILNGWFNDPHWLEGSRMHWLLTRAEVELLAEYAACWQRATRGSNLSIGLDRATYCRFILDLGLVKTEKAPFFWAVSLFDVNATLIRACPTDTAAWAPSAPIVHCVSLWKLMNVLDTVLKQHYAVETKHEFIQRLCNLDCNRFPKHLANDLAKVMAGPKLTAVRGMQQSRPLSPKSPMKSAATSRQTSMEFTASACSSPRLGNTAEKHGFSPASTADVKDSAMTQSVLDVMCRDRLLSSMLVEPDVLHIAMQHFCTFQALHQCYADEHGHMSLPKLLQFLTDYRFVPDLCSANTVQGFYDEAATVQLVEGSAPPGSRKPSPERQFRLQTNPAALDKDLAKEGLAAEQQVLRGAGHTAVGSKSKRKISEKVDKGSEQSPRQQRPPSKSAHDDSPGRPRPMLPSLGAAFAMTGDKVQATGDARAAAQIAPDESPPARLVSSRPDSGNLARSPRRRNNGKRAVSKFDAAAFMEVLSKTAFLHLGFYGNTAQQSSPTYARFVWLLVYLRHVAKHYESHATLHEGSMNDSLKKAIRLTTAPGCIPAALRTYRTILDVRPQGSPDRSPTTTRGPPPERKLSNAAIVSWMKPKDKPTSIRLKQALLQKQRPVPEPVPEKEVVTDDADSSDADLHEKEDPAEVERRSLVKARAWSQVRALSRSISFEEPPPCLQARQQAHRLSDASASDAASEDEEDSSPDAPGSPGGMCVMKGRCLLCRRSVPKTSWGYARCRGCSVVDTFSYDMHPWKALLQLPPALPQQAAPEPAVVRPKPNVPAHELQVSRPPVTPPPVSADTARMLKLFAQTDAEVSIRRRPSTEAAKGAAKQQQDNTAGKAQGSGRKK